MDNMKMLDKIKNYAEHYENEVRDISNQLRDEMMPEICLTNMRLQEIVCAMRKATSREESFYLHLVLQVWSGIRKKILKILSSADAFERKDENTILISFAKAYDVSGVDTVLREISFEKETGSFTVSDHVVCDVDVPVFENLVTRYPVTVHTCLLYTSDAADE